jgi:nucleoside-diphosphate-sugar epimerase
VGRAYARAITHPVSGAFNIAAEPVLDAATIAATLGTRPLELPPRALRAVADASWRLRLQPTSPGWLDMGMAAPLMDTTRASRELGFVPTARADETLRELVRGIRAGAGFPTPPLDPHSGGALRWREFASGVGARA